MRRKSSIKKDEGEAREMAEWVKLLPHTHTHTACINIPFSVQYCSVVWIHYNLLVYLFADEH